MQDMEHDLKVLLVGALALEDITPDEIGSDEPLFGAGLGLDLPAPDAGSQRLVAAAIPDALSCPSPLAIRAASNPTSPRPRGAPACQGARRPGPATCGGADTANVCHRQPAGRAQPTAEASALARRARRPALPARGRERRGARLAHPGLWSDTGRLFASVTARVAGLRSPDDTGIHLFRRSHVAPF